MRLHISKLWSNVMAAIRKFHSRLHCPAKFVFIFYSAGALKYPILPVWHPGSLVCWILLSHLRVFRYPAMSSRSSLSLPCQDLYLRKLISRVSLTIHAVHTHLAVNTKIFEYTICSAYKFGFFENTKNIAKAGNFQWKVAIARTQWHTTVCNADLYLAKLGGIIVKQ